MKNKHNSSSNAAEEILETAKFYFLNCKFDEAIAEFNKVLKLNPGNAEAWYTLGLIHENRNNMDQAKIMYEKSLNINPDNKLAREHLNRITGLSDE